MRPIFAILLLALTALCVAPAAVARTGDVTLKGQVVCSDCWFEQKDRKAHPYGTDADLKCVVRCAKADIPQAIVVWNGDSATLYLLENGAFKNDAADFLAFAGKEIEVTGTTRVVGDKQYLKVNALKVIPGVPAVPASEAPRTREP